MAGGWSKQGSGIPLSERVRPGWSDQSAPTPPTPDPGETCPARHCWVADAVDRHGAQRPGLLVEWRQGVSSWEGRVVYAARLRPEGWLLVEEWVAAALLTPA